MRSGKFGDIVVCCGGVAVGGGEVGGTGWRGERWLRGELVASCWWGERYLNWRERYEVEQRSEVGLAGLPDWLAIRYAY